MPVLDFTLRPILSSDELAIIKKHLDERSDSALRLFLENPIVIVPAQFERIKQAFDQMCVSAARGLARLSHAIDQAARAFDDFVSKEVQTKLVEEGKTVISAPDPEPIVSISPLAAFEMSVRSKRDAIFREMFGVADEVEDLTYFGNKIEKEQAPPASDVPSIGHGGNITIQGGTAPTSSVMIFGGAGGGTASGGNFMGVSSGDAARAGNMMGQSTMKGAWVEGSIPANGLPTHLKITLKNEG